MIEILKDLFKSGELLKGKYGIERETLRVNNDGKLSKKTHPKGFGNKLKNKYITIDFSESQIEMVTPPLDNMKELHNFLNMLYDIVSVEIGDEYLWPQSMPCLIENNDEIPIGTYDDSEEGKRAAEYRKSLIKTYGGRKQLICGIHYNFSFDENIIKKLYESKKLNINGDYKKFRDEII